jgi:uncharacterized protein YkwD
VAAPADVTADLVTVTRTDVGVSALARSEVLDARAERWAARLARTGELAHDDPWVAVPAGCRRVGENVGYAGDAGALHEAWLASPPHHDTMLDAHYDTIGVGVAVEDGRLYAVHVFADCLP